MFLRCFLVIVIFIHFHQSYSQEELVFNAEILNAISTRDVPQGAPGIATGIVYRGEIVYVKNAGFANVENENDIKGNSRFNIASMAKQFTALAVLFLEKEGRLQMEDDIRKYFPKLLPQVKEAITIKHLLTHTSGIRDVYALWSLQGITWWKETFGNQDAMDLLYGQSHLNFTPGTKHDYSNSNYIILAELIDKVSEDGFFAFTDKIFQQLEMNNTAFTINYKKIEGEIAEPYFNFSKWTGYKWTCNIVGDGNLFSSIDDQLQWEKIIQLNGMGLIDPDLVNRSQHFISGYEFANYSYGLEFGVYKDQEYKYHLGSTGAWKSATTRFPAYDIAVVTLTNSGKVTPDAQTLRMVDQILGLDENAVNYPIVPEKEGEPLEVSEIVGNYITSEGYFVQFREVDGELILIRNGRNDTKLIRENANTFQQWNDAPFKQEFLKNEEGNIQVTFYYPSVAPFTLSQIKTTYSSIEREVLEGSYYNASLDLKFDIKQDKDGNLQASKGKRKFPLYPIDKDTMKAGDYFLTFDKDQNELVTGLKLSSNRLQNVEFIKVK